MALLLLNVPAVDFEVLRESNIPPVRELGTLQ